MSSLPPLPPIRLDDLVALVAEYERGCTASELMEALGWSRPMVRRHLRAAERRGQLRRRGDQPPGARQTRWVLAG